MKSGYSSSKVKVLEQLVQKQLEIERIFSQNIRTQTKISHAMGNKRTSKAFKENFLQLKRFFYKPYMVVLH